MKVDNVSRVQFCAQVPQSLREELFGVAVSRGTPVVKAYRKQLERVANWGLDTSTLSVRKIPATRSSINLYAEASPPKYVLSLINSYLMPMRRVEFTQKDNLLDTFLSLTSKDIANAERKLKL